MAVMRRIIGPPGTGKTGYLRWQIEQWLDRGVDPDRIMVVSHTRAAARVIAERVALPPEQVGTLHAMGYRALGRPPIAETGRLAREWNASVPPPWQITGERDDDAPADMPADMPGSMSPWDRMMMARARCEPVPPDLADLEQAWAQYRMDHDAVDYADMLELPVRRRLPPPGGPTHLVVDEAQDLTPAGWALVRWWAQHVREVVVAGDPAQVIYDWAGASPAPLLEAGWDERMLDRSWRLAPDVAEYAERWLTRHSGPLGQGRWYRAADVEGTVRHVGVRLRDAEAVADMAEREARAGRRVMVIAQSAYMLQPVIAVLRRLGVPFHNPYRPTAGQWNPMRVDAGDGRVSTLRRVLAFVRPLLPGGRLWEPDDIMLWARMLRADQYRERGARDRLLTEARPTLMDDLAGALVDEARAGWEAVSLDWLERAALAEYRPQVAWARAVAARCGVEALAERPRVIVGTIHSVKGGEADVVVAAPDVSPASARAGDRDALVRLWYVAATRARGDLVVLAPSAAHAVC